MSVGRGRRRRSTSGATARLAAALAAVAILAPGPVLVAGPASAHTDLISSIPADGAVLTAAPRVVALTFTARLLTPGMAVVVRTPEGVFRRLEPQSQDTTVRASWPSDIGVGAFSVTYRVVATDGHPIEGQVRFTIADDGRTGVRSPSSAAMSTATPATAFAPARNGSSPAAAATLAAVVATTGAVLVVVRRRRAGRRPGADRVTSRHSGLPSGTRVTHDLPGDIADGRNRH